MSFSRLSVALAALPLALAPALAAAGFPAEEPTVPAKEEAAPPVVDRPGDAEESREAEEAEKADEAEAADASGVSLLERAKERAAALTAAAQQEAAAMDPEQTDQDAAQDEDEPDIVIRYAEEVAVTGTAIRETPIDSPYSVSILNRDALLQQGSPQLVDMFKNLTVSSGVIGEVNSWYAGAPNVPETVANVNLRGLGASRTLVLLNGRRTAYLPAQLPGGRYVDVNTIPGIAIDRLDVLKEGAGAIYGSDAIGGVVNFVTRNRFEGLEVQASHEYFSGAGDSLFSGIWGKRVGNSNVMVAFEHQRRQQLNANERDFVLRPYANWWWGWSGIGNPGAFIVPQGGPADAASLAAAPRFTDPQCESFGGYVDNGVRSCRFRYQAWDALIYAGNHTRGVAEITGDVGEHGHYRIEGLYADSRTPEWETTPAFPPVSQFNQLQFVGPDHPGRQALVANMPTLADTGGNPLDLTGNQPWYFYGRLVGNSGPGRIPSPRTSVTQRIAATLGSELGETGLHYDLGAVYARATGDVSQPAEWGYRKFLAFRGYGGANCGVGVVVDPNSPTRMALGEVPSGAVPGQGNCMYYNPFANGLESSAQPGSPLEGAMNPEFQSGLGNSAELLGWINDEVVIASTSDLFTADATVNGNLNDNISYAVGYQFRRVSATGRPNDAGNLSLNPCLVPGDTGCAIQTGPFTFTTARNPYDAQQTTHAAFTEFALSLGDRLDAQVAAHYERYEFADSWDPKLSMIWELSDAFALRGTVQTSFRTPSLDDVNEDLITLLDWVGASGTWKAIDDRGNSQLVPEEAFSYNIGMTAQDEETGVEATLDFWSFDFDNPIGTLPHGGLASAYANPATRAAVQSRIVCPGGVADGSCDPVDIERIRVNRINWPGLQTSGLDWHFGYRRAIGLSALVLNFDGSYTLDFTVDALDYNGVELQEERQAAGFLNRANPLAPPLPQMRSHLVASWLYGNFTVTGAGRFISGYMDRGTVADYENIDSWLTFDGIVQYRVPSSSMVVTLSGLNLFGTYPPLVNQEQAFDALTHNPKGRRVKLGISYTF